MAWYDYVPGVSNVAGFAKGDVGQGLLGPLGYGLGNQAAQGSNTAAQGASAASGGYGDLANWQWDTAMGGLGAAQGAYNPSNALWQGTYGNQGPNALDQWWGQNQAAFNQPTASQGAMNQFQTYMQQPTMAGSAYQNAQGQLGYSQGKDYYDRFGGQMQNRSQQEMAYNPNNYSSPGAAESFYGQAQGTLGGPGRAAQLNYQDTTNMGDFARGLGGQQGQGATNQGAGEIGNYYRGANDVSQYAGGQMGQLTGPGTYEQFVTQDINGTNPMMQRQTDQGLARINQEQARRGGFRSGSADTQVGNFLGEMGAREYDQRADRAQSAQQMQLSRIGAGTGLAQASAQGKLAQGQGLQGLAGQQDAEKMGRLGQQLQAQQGASAESLANSQGRMNYAQAGDQNDLARMQMLGGFAGQAQNAEMARLAGGMNAAGQSDQGFMARQQAGYGMAQGADQSNLARLMGLQGMAQGADQGQMARYGMLNNMAGQVDQNSLARLLGAGGMAGNVTQADQQQLNDMFRTRFGLDNANAGMIQGFYGQGAQGYGDAQSNSLNALANYYALIGQGQDARAAVPWQAANVGVKFAGA